MSVDQTAFRAALLDPEAPVPAGLVDAEGAPAGKRFDVYRNNVAVSLTEALEVAFPVVRKLVGDEFFKAMAGVFLRRHPPTSPILALYGADFPRFLRGFKPAASLGYLPDVARLEQAIRESFHAADTLPADPARLQALAPDALIRARLTLAPSLRLIRSPWPIHGIWRFNTEAGAPQPPGEAQDVLITRTDYDPRPHLLPPGGADFVEALQSGDSFGAALGKARTVARDFDLTATLGLLIGGEAITDIHTDEAPDERHLTTA